MVLRVRGWCGTWTCDLSVTGAIDQALHTTAPRTFGPLGGVSWLFWVSFFYYCLENLKVLQHWAIGHPGFELGTSELRVQSLAHYTTTPMTCLNAVEVFFCMLAISYLNYLALDHKRPGIWTRNLCSQSLFIRPLDHQTEQRLCTFGMLFCMLVFNY